MKAEQRLRRLKRLAQAFIALSLLTVLLNLLISTILTDDQNDLIPQLRALPNFDDIPSDTGWDTFFCSSPQECQSNLSNSQKPERYNLSNCLPRWNISDFSRFTPLVRIGYHPVPSVAFPTTNDCPEGVVRFKMGKWKKTMRRPLPPEIAQHVNFSTVLKTNLRILVIGDPTATQIFDMLRLSMGFQDENITIIDGLAGNEWDAQFGVGLVQKQLGLWSVTGLLFREHQNKPPYEGWNCSTVQSLMKHLLPDAFDVVIIQIAHRWFPLRTIYMNNIYETMSLSQELFGFKHAIFVNMPFVTKLRPNERGRWMKKNAQLQTLVDLMKPQGTVPGFPERIPLYQLPGIQHVLILDLARLTNDFTSLNAKLLGMQVDSNLSYYDVRAKEGNPKHPPAVAHVCANNKVRGCHFNSISMDGFKLCSNTYRGRIVGGIGCLLKCLYVNENITSLYVCERACNDKYMNLEYPILE